VRRCVGIRGIVTSVVLKTCFLSKPDFFHLLIVGVEGYSFT
jgi:hypothetical protein